MTDAAGSGDGVQGSFDIPEDTDEAVAEARRVADRLRRRKRALERRNPLNDLDGYRRRFREVVEMEARLRELRAAGDASEPD